MSKLFIIHYILSENKKNVFFTVFWGDLEGAGTLYPCTQATFKSPVLLGLTQRNQVLQKIFLKILQGWDYYLGLLLF